MELRRCQAALVTSRLSPRPQGASRSDRSDVQSCCISVEPPRLNVPWWNKSATLVLSHRRLHSMRSNSKTHGNVKIDRSRHRKNRNSTEQRRLCWFTNSFLQGENIEASTKLETIRAKNDCSVQHLCQASENGHQHPLLFYFGSNLSNLRKHFLEIATQLVLLDIKALFLESILSLGLLTSL